MQEWTYVYPDYLSHHGILGQKWGVRRFQNPDGTLTPAGRRRYNMDSEGNLTKKTRKEIHAYKKAEKAEKKEKERRLRIERENETREAKKSRIAKTLDPAQIYENRELFSDQELNALYMRMNLERNVSSLIPKGKEKSYAETVQNLSNKINNTANLINSGTNLYNNTARVINSLTDNDLPLIGQPKESERDKKVKKLKAENELMSEQIRQMEYVNKLKDYEAEQKSKELARQAKDAQNRLALSKAKSNEKEEVIDNDDEDDEEKKKK